MVDQPVLGPVRQAIAGLTIAAGAFMLFSPAHADGLVSVPQLNNGSTSVYVPQLGQAPKRVVRSVPRRTTPAPARTAQQARPPQVRASRILDFSESTEALGFRLPSVRQGVRIAAQ